MRFSPASSPPSGTEISRPTNLCYRYCSSIQIRNVTVMLEYAILLGSLELVEKASDTVLVLARKMLKDLDVKSGRGVCKGELYQWLVAG